MNNFKRLMAMGMVLVLCVLPLAACSAGTEPAPSATENLRGEGIYFYNTLNYPTGPDDSVDFPEAYAIKARDAHTENSDTVGWLAVPDTSLDDVVVWYPGDRNEFYLRRDFNKRWSWDGSYFADYRAHFNGGRAGLSQNIVIYGHSMEDDPNKPLFSQLKKFLSVDFAQMHPYIYFSTPDEDMAWEIFAVFYGTNRLPYNTPNPSAEEFSNIITEVRARSIYNYSTKVTAEDTVITLSTCCYNFTPVYPNDYRYVIMARLVPAGEQLRATADFEINPSPKAP